jgi:proline racemase
MRFIASLFLLLLVGIAGGATTTTINCKTGGGTFLNVVTQAAVNSTENIVVIQVTPGTKVTVDVWSGTDWYYRSSANADGTGTHDSTTQEPVASSRVEKLCFTETTTFYHVRQTADGTLYLKPIAVEPNKQQ